MYENAEKLFALKGRPIGVAIYGLGSIGQRSIGSYLRQFELADPGGVVSGNTTMAQVVEALRDFFLQAYMAEVVPVLETQLGKPYKDIPLDQRPALGFVVGGYSHGEFLSEIWDAIIPVHDQPNSARLTRDKGNFGTNWFAMFEPIRRYLVGFDAALADDIGKFIEKLLGRAMKPTERDEYVKLLGSREYPVPFAAMPMEEGVEHARFLVELVIGHHRYTISTQPQVGGALVVGGRVQIGRVTYRDAEFTILGD